MLSAPGSELQWLGIWGNLVSLLLVFAFNGAAQACSISTDHTIMSAHHQCNLGCASKTEAMCRSDGLFGITVGPSHQGPQKSWSPQSARDPIMSWHQLSFSWRG
ncbi:hypothetical protein QBC37DRAFT_35373 [Rhypophila decipiens]|uniref:Uncharacterized protein n=1 Tax=Rhypophila decipiens TaxID=261697 RepID=A0AAN6Y1K8_9PEZI|nr:hypothetical protein QBC37DRAFT_35373 [Rhypophila decipiens]